MSLFRTISLTLMLLLGSGVTAFAEEIYTWVDEFGVTHFSRQKPNENERVTKIDTVSRVESIRTDQHDDWLMTLCPEGVKRDVSLEQQSVERQYREKLKNCREDHSRGLLLGTLSQCYGAQQRWRTQELQALELNQC